MAGFRKKPQAQASDTGSALASHGGIANTGNMYIAEFHQHVHPAPPGKDSTTPPQRGTPVAALTPQDATASWEVHQAITVGPGESGPLPMYVRRDHDENVRAVVARAASGTSAMVVLIGESSTGKTRACWEAIHELPAGWRLWHPLDPTPAEALAVALEEGIGPRTAIWLNEIQRYVGERAGDSAERVAAGLRALLQDQDHAPVLILGTTWPEYWASLTSHPAPGKDDSHPQARELLEGKALYVPASFGETALEDLRTLSGHDPRLSDATKRAVDGSITQYLAGAPALLERYRAAPPGALAVIRAAMDASRLEAGSQVPRAFLEAASHGYLTDDQYDALPDTWIVDALAYTAEPCKGARGPLSMVRQRPGTPVTDGPRYRLADYLDQHGRHERRFTAPPASLWEAARDHLEDPQTLQALGSAAESRWRDRHAIELYQKALDFGQAEVFADLFWLWEEHQHAQEAERVLRQAAITGSGEALEGLLERLLDQDRHEDAETALRDAAASGNPAAILLLARALEEEGEADEAAHWYQRAAESNDPEVLRACAADLESNGDLPIAQQLLRAVGDHHALRELARLTAETGPAADAEQAAMDAFTVNEPTPLRDLAARAEAEGRDEDAERMYLHAIAAYERRRRLRAAGTVIDFEGGPRPLSEFVNPTQLLPPGETWALRSLVALRDRTGRAPAGDDALHTAGDDGNAWAMEQLLRRYRSRGQEEQAESLLLSAAEADNPWALWALTYRCLHSGTTDETQCRALLERAAAAGVGQATKALVEQAEQDGRTTEAEQLALRAAAAGYTTPLRDLIMAREQGGQLAAAEDLAFRAPAPLRRAILQRLANGREGEQATAFLRHATDEDQTWALGVLSARLDSSGEPAEAERLARRAADSGDRQALHDLAQQRAARDPDGTWHALLLHGLAADGTTTPAW
ncbi:hypothetical protein ACFVRD_44335 [Streptomyces sp. NPDC057908]|uniref:hypothetical protein n=1 Tax=Streptomyces sp. NPDC057908 TaxID=3346276 RepID=UPI0036ED3A26